MVQTFENISERFEKAFVDKKRERINLVKDRLSEEIDRLNELKLRTSSKEQKSKIEKTLDELRRRRRELTENS